MNSLVDYYSSSSDEEIETTSLKRKSSPMPEQSNKMPKLPSFFGESKQEELKDSAGKKRTVPHKSNSWATYVYFQVDLTDDKENLLSYCKGLEPIEEQHISLSRTVYLKYHELDPFVDSIKKAMADIESFYLSFAQTSCLTNDEKTRSFITLEVGYGYDRLLKCLNIIDSIMQKYKQPVFYNPPIFHTSIAWSLDKSLVESIKIPQSCLDNVNAKVFGITRIYIKQGHLIKHIDLQ